jgi:hypothetical protein
MKRLCTFAALTLGLAISASAQLPFRALTYHGCGTWGCATLQLSGSLTYGVSMFDASDDWFYQGSLRASVQDAPAGLTVRTDGWTFDDVVGNEENLHRYAGVWGEPYLERADFSTDFFAPSISGHIDACVDPGRVICNDGYTDYGVAHLELVSVTSAPEPATLFLFATGLLGVFVEARRGGAHPTGGCGKRRVA